MIHVDYEIASDVPKVISMINFLNSINNLKRYALKQKTLCIIVEFDFFAKISIG
jgi:hypothetical protein